MIVRRSFLVAAVTVALVCVASAGAAPPTGLIVFSATSTDSQIDQLYSIPAAGGEPKQLTTGIHPADAPAFSPNGKLIAFQRGTVGLFTIRPDGTGLHRLTSNGRDAYPAWSPDGKSIAFIRPIGTVWRVYVMPSTGGRQRPLKKGPPAGRPSWTTAGLLIPSGGDLLRIDTANGHVLKYYGANIDAIWGQNSVTLSPKLSSLTYVGSRQPDAGDKECGEGPCQRFGLFFERLVGKHRKPLLIVKDTGPAAYSPDGTRLAYAAGGKLILRSVASGGTMSIETGTLYPTVAGPPAWR